MENYRLTIEKKIKAALKKVSIIKILWNYHRVNRGFKVYQNILAEFGQDAQIYIEHYPGTGDVYLTCALLEKYRKKNDIHGNYALTVIGKGATKIARLFSINNIKTLTQTESDDLINFIRFMAPEQFPNIKILHYSPTAMHTAVLDMLASYHGLDFMTMYLTTVFPNISREDACDFPPSQNIEEIQEIFDAKGLIPGKTVVLFPFANTIENLSWHAWERMARNLREKGFTVCTNVEPEKPAVLGTCDVFVPYSQLQAFVDMAGYVVGLRSGIFDIIARTSCQKFILYPTPNYYKFGVGTFYDYFSLKNMGISDDAHEYQFERIYETRIFRKVTEDVIRIYESQKIQG